MPEESSYGFIFDFVIRDSRAQECVPVDQALAAENETIGEHFEKRLAYRPTADRVHGKSLAVPVAGAAHALLLAYNTHLVLVLPLPDAFHQALTTYVVSGQALQFFKALFHHRLGGC